MVTAVILLGDMIIIIRPDTSQEEIDYVISKLKDKKLRPVPLVGVERTVIAVIGDDCATSMDGISALSAVERVMPVSKPYKLVSREAKEEGTVVTVDGVKIGGKEVVVIAGPCAVESEEQVLETAKAVKKAGAKILRGGAFKPRTAPYSFQGLGEEGLKILAKAREETGLPIVTEAMDVRSVELVAKYADIIQVGSRNMQNFSLLKEVGCLNKPVLLKRGASATLTEFLMAAEYIMLEGNHQIILCERGICSFSDHTRNTLDLSIIPLVKTLTHLPIIVDPSHATGKYELITPMSKAALAAGADGLMVEVHCDPEKALSDAGQSLKPKDFVQLMKELKPLVKGLGREV